MVGHGGSVGRRITQAASVLVSASMIGCSWPGLSPGATEAPKKSQFAANQPLSAPAVPNENPAAAAPDSDPQALAAVMDFLDRTKGYEQETHGEKEPAPIASAATRKSATAVGGRPVHHKPEIETLILNDAPGSGERSDSASSPSATAAKSEAALANAQLSLADGSLKPAIAAPTVTSVRVRAVDTATTSRPSTLTPANTTNQSMDVSANGTTDGAAALLSALSDQARETPSFDHEWSLRLLQMALHQSPDCAEVGKGLSSEHQRLLSSMVALLTVVHREAVDPLLPGEGSLVRAAEFNALLAERSDPVIGAIALCRKVVTFGVIEEMPPEEFISGRATPTIVYSEIYHLQTEKNAEGLHRSALATRMELLTADGQSVWQHEEPEITDLCRNRRSDFFIAQRISLPATLREGPHVLKLMVEDKLSGRTAEQTHRFTVHAGTTLAKGK